MSTDERLLKDLPEAFTRKQLMKEVLKNGFSQTKCEKIIERYVLTGEIERVKPGSFRKSTAMH